MAIRREEAIKRHLEYTGQLSTQCRTLSLGLLAFIWALLTKESPLRGSDSAITPHTRWNLLAIALVVILALVCDALQYFAGLKVQERFLTKIGESDTGFYAMDGMYRLQTAAFWAKLFGIGFAVAWLLLYIGLWLL